MSKLLVLAGKAFRFAINLLPYILPFLFSEETRNVKLDKRTAKAAAKKAASATVGAAIEAFQIKILIVVSATAFIIGIVCGWIIHP